MEETICNSNAIYEQCKNNLKYENSCNFDSNSQLSFKEENSS